MRFKTLAQWLDWQSTLNPSEIDLGLERVEQVLAAMQLCLFIPGSTCRASASALLSMSPAAVITVAGTNGKGSCVAYLDALYQAAGYRVGCYTSPHLLRYNERVCINGQPATDQDLCQAFAEVDAARGSASLTYFEFGTLAALAVFAKANVEVMILEVGLGGRLDAVNVVDPDVAVITSLDIDHVDWLGGDRNTIAIEKAGIFRAHRPAVCGDSNPPPAIALQAAHHQSDLYQRDVDFSVEINDDDWILMAKDFTFEQLPYPALAGQFQFDNAATAIMAARLLADRCDLKIDALHVRQALTSVSLAGRCQQLSADPVVIVDVGHNPHSARALAEYLAQSLSGCNVKTHCIIAMMADKDITGFIEALAPQIDYWYPAELDVSRAASCETLVELLGQLSPSLIDRRQIMAGRSVAAQLKCALQAAGRHDRVLICGSFYTVAEVLPLLHRAEIK